MSKSITGTFTTNTESSPIVILQQGIVFCGGAGGSDFGSGTVTVQCKGPDGQWYASGTTFTAAGVKTLVLGLPTEVRLSMAGSTSPDCDYAIQSDTPVIVES